MDIMNKMEDLRETMKDMFKSIKKQDGDDKYLYFSPKYNPKVKISDWYLPLEADPKDNNPYDPPGGDYFLSTYNRFGNDVVTMESETSAMLRQICSNTQQASIRKPMITATTDQLLLEDEEQFCMGQNCNEIDFTTTYDYDFRDPFPYRRKKPLTPAKEDTWKRFPIHSNFDSTKIPNSKFIDDEFYSVKPNLNAKVQPPYQTYEIE